MNLLPNCQNTKIQGSPGSGQAIAYFTKMGYIVSLPLNDSQDYDLIIDIQDILYKVQVKTTTIKSKSGYYQPYIRQTCKNTKRNYTKPGTELKYDFLFVTTDSFENWFIPKNIIENIKTGFVLNKNFDKYKVNSCVGC